MITKNLINRVTGEGQIANGVELKAAGTETGNHFGLVEFSMTEGEPVTPMHIHNNEDESVYILSGGLTFYVGDESFDAEAGSFTFLPKGTAHGFRVKSGSGAAKILLFMSPGGTERFLVPADGQGEKTPADFGLEILDPVPGS